MGSDAQRRLQERLARVAALHEGATTPGERAAARKALDRVVDKLTQAIADDEVGHFVRAYVASLGVPEPEHVQRARGLPDADELGAALRAWERGDTTDPQLHAWASDLVDTVVLPHDPHHEGACRAEVLLQLASRRLGSLQISDLPRIRSFLDERDWGAWFQLLESAARRAA